MKGQSYKSDRRSNSKVKDNPRTPQTPTNSSKLMNKQNKEAPFYTKNAMEIMNKLSDNYKDVKEVNILFDDNSSGGRLRQAVKHTSSSNIVSNIRPSTPQQKKPVKCGENVMNNNYTSNTNKPKSVKSAKLKGLTKEKAVIIIQRQLRKYLKVNLKCYFRESGVILNTKC
jgi:5S rRNA maturation endonuclease (ribonuclease M5)